MSGDWFRDARGWLVHVAPGLLVRTVWRGAFRAGRWFVVRGVPGVARFVGLAVVGGWWLARCLGRYLLAYREYGPLVRELEVEAGRAHRAKTAREAWRRAAYRRLCLVGGVLVGLVGGLAVLGDRYGAWVSWAAWSTLAVVCAAVGRARRPARPRADVVAGSVLVPNEPFPIADAHTRGQAADCVARAVAAEGIELRGVEGARRTPWGWEAAVVLKRGTPAGLVAKVAELETTLDLPSGGVLAAPDRGRRARVVLRLAERDPFAGLAVAPDRAAGSLSIKDAHVVGARMSGDDLRLSLYGVHAVVIGGPGAGKSQTMRTLADAVSACADAVVWDLDPAGNGLEVLGGGVERVEREQAGIEAALADAVAMAQTRPKLLTRLGMGDAWDASPERPAVVVFCDEYPRLSDQAKALAVDLIRIGRKSRVTLVLAASEATSDALGAAVAEIAALKIMHACRHADVRLVLGANMIGEGWRPDRLNPATGEAPEDAGVCFVHAAGSRDPILNKIRPVPAGRARLNGPRRAAQGLPRIDADSLAGARPVEDSVDRVAVVDVLAVFGSDDRLWTDTVLSRLATVDGRYAAWTAEDLAAVLVPLGVRPGQVKIGNRNRNGYRRAVLGDAWDLYRGGR
ncbi:DNA segregation ATPase FtsK/SpoIIIE, S-DNA-T family [Actinokineospora terrae]|uniref:DNA segregation ATPase FtsK/SpoIIIE, S-DNA-T family n=1 Tax=Actinokineospora terrae TaxID=155974 RepID=A0A1H9W0Q4_9PSEU|nr:DNA segregation ATPase FtsK/SpoIIIE, S-DNA-T family [Actinokineospora terrae]